MSTSEEPAGTPELDMSGLETATFGAGCFWCVEAVFTELKGVKQVLSGYANGRFKNPSYREVCTGNTGFAEVARIVFNPSEIMFKDLLEVFWKTHDPTTLNRQGGDVGTQYRSGVFFHTAAQKELAEHYKAELDRSGAFAAPIVTEIVPLENFYPAEDYHQSYFAENGEQQYCQLVIRPKVEKFKSAFHDKLKS